MRKKIKQRSIFQKDIPETICLLFRKSDKFKFHTLSNIQVKSEDQKFYEWLAGYIDGDGYFACSKQGYVSLEITTHQRDKNCFDKIQEIFCGYIKKTSLATHFPYHPSVGKERNLVRYRFHNKERLLKLINALNGQLRNYKRLNQFQKVCEFYNIDLKVTNPLTYDNGWFSGFLDSDGSIYLNLTSQQLFTVLQATKKTSILVESLVALLTTCFALACFAHVVMQTTCYARAKQARGELFLRLAQKIHLLNGR